VDSSQVDVFTQSDVQAVSMFASQISMAIEDALWQKTGNS